MTREEAIKTIRLTCPKISDSECDFETAMRFLIPELAESEDEKIRRKMIEHFKSKTKETWCNMPVKSIISYLEKHKESLHISEMRKENADSFTDEDERIRVVILKLVLGMRDEIFTTVDKLVTKPKVLAWLKKHKEEEGYEAIPVESTLEYKLGFKAGKESEKQKEQKPAEKQDYPSEPACHGKELEAKMYEACSRYGSNKEDAYSLSEVFYAGVKVGKEFQKPAEWSEEEYGRLFDIEHYLDGTLQLNPDRKIACIDFLKSLRPSWKPSEDEERLINTSISFLKDFADKGYENAVECIDWLKSKLNGNSCK